MTIFGFLSEAAKTAHAPALAGPSTFSYICPQDPSRAVIHKVALVNLKSYVGRQEIGLSQKSTVLKRTKLIHHGGYNEQERDSYKEIIFSNTVQSMRAILESMPQLDISLPPQNDARRAVILSLPAQIEADVLLSNVSDSVRGLWRDPSVKEAVRRSREFQLNDSAVYYFNSIDRMSAPGYLPTDQDILRRCQDDRYHQDDISEPYARSVDSLRLGMQIVVVRQDIDHPDPEQDRSLHSEKLPRSPLGDYFPDCSVEVHFREIVDFIFARALCKSNTNKYTINGRQSSYKEVQILLKGHGMDLDHNWFLIHQGEVESIAQMKPKLPSEHEDGLLEYLEDIIGTSKYEEPIEEALAEMERLSKDRCEMLNRLRIVEKEKNKSEEQKREAEDYLRLQNEHVRVLSRLWQYCLWSFLLNDEKLSKNKYEYHIQEVKAHAAEAVKDLADHRKQEVGLEERRKRIKGKIKKLNKSVGHKAQVFPGRDRRQDSELDMLVKKAERVKDTSKEAIESLQSLQHDQKAKVRMSARRIRSIPTTELRMCALPCYVPALQPLPPRPGPVLGTLSSFVSPAKTLDFEIIEGLGRIEQDIVDELATRIEGVDKDDIWEYLRRDDGSQGNVVTVAYMLLRDKQRLGHDLAEFEEQERNAHLAAIDLRNLTCAGRGLNSRALMNAQLYMVDSINYLIDFRQKKSYKALIEPGAGKVDMASPESVRGGLRVEPVDEGEEHARG
ncbi:hypothetical protein EWM64_g5108 [Hericium alpestre]|uniref:Carbon catabolite-derepressing protein kinase ubiquitin-associated domain-containing protein n=1 Tax=Hericium alpestre TaxID=135208 RepID=A0A4Y9ZXZ4_9AGAM|nr:hypothetical protein EWM64_g5108 [Hericium alpestre]